MTTSSKERAREIISDEVLVLVATPSPAMFLEAERQLAEMVPAMRAVFSLFPFSVIAGAFFPAPGAMTIELDDGAEVTLSASEMDALRLRGNLHTCARLARVAPSFLFLAEPAAPPPAKKPDSN